MENIESTIGYTFKDKKLLSTALTHSSYANELKSEHNERLEFLGDSVLSVIISDCLYRRLPNVDEGQLSKYRATLVCEQSLAEVSGKISLSSLIKLGRGEELTGGRSRPSILSDAMEAVIAAIYLDGGMDSAYKWVLELMKESIDEVITGHRYADYKTMVQEILQRGNEGKVTYRTIKESGLDHNKHFEVEVLVDGKPKNRGVGNSKKAAEQDAAHSLYEKLRADKR